jgi:hypothetical protein
MLSETQPKEKWLAVFRGGILPQLSTPGLEGLRQALAADDPRLLQGTTCYPAILEPNKDREVVAGCAVTFTGLADGTVRTVEDADRYFRQVCDVADRCFSEPVASRYFLNVYDDLPRDEMRAALLAEVGTELQRRARQEAAVA